MNAFEIGDYVQVKATGETGKVKQIERDRFGNLTCYVVIHEVDLSHDTQAGWKYTAAELEPSEVGHKITRSGGRSTVNHQQNWQ